MTVVALCSCGCGLVQYAKGFAKPCYYRIHQKQRGPRDQSKYAQPGLVRVPIKGWGSL